MDYQRDIVSQSALNIDDILDTSSDSQIDVVGTRTFTEEAVKELDPTKLTASEFRSTLMQFGIGNHSDYLAKKKPLVEKVYSMFHLDEM